MAAWRNGMDQGLLWGYSVSPDEVQPLETLDAAARSLGDGKRFTWVHLDANLAEVRAWLSRSADLEPLIVDALLAAETRPRCTMIGGSIILTLRGLNFNEGAAPEDMVSIRIWTDGTRLISARLRQLRAASAVKAELDAGRGPRSVGDAILQLVRNLTQYMAPVITDYEEELDGLEAEVSDQKVAATRTELREFRHKVVTLRRFIAPQRDALSQLASLPIEWRTEPQRQGLIESTNEITRLVEILGATWERTAILQDELTTILSEQANRRLYVLSIVAAVFLPLGFVTGLLGINVGGIPGADFTGGFLIVSGLLLALGVAEIALFRVLRWF